MRWTTSSPRCRFVSKPQYASRRRRSSRGATGQPRWYDAPSSAAVTGDTCAKNGGSTERTPTAATASATARTGAATTDAAYRPPPGSYGVTGYRNRLHRGRTGNRLQINLADERATERCNRLL